MNAPLDSLNVTTLAAARAAAQPAGQVMGVNNTSPAVGGGEPPLEVVGREAAGSLSSEATQTYLNATVTRIRPASAGGDEVQPVYGTVNAMIEKYNQYVKTHSKAEAARDISFQGLMEIAANETSYREAPVTVAFTRGGDMLIQTQGSEYAMTSYDSPDASQNLIITVNENGPQIFSGGSDFTLDKIPTITASDLRLEEQAARQAAAAAVNGPTEQDYLENEYRNIPAYRAETPELKAFRAAQAEGEKMLEAARNGQLTTGAPVKASTSQGAGISH